LWKKWSRRDNEQGSEWNAWAKNIFTRNRIESFVEPYTTWFKPITCKFSGKIVFEEYARGQVVFNSTWSSRQRVIYERGNSVEYNGEESNDNGDSNFEATTPIKAISKRTLNSYFRRNK
jgi:hypothetical protein